jgi:hypothetical protein
LRKTLAVLCLVLLPAVALAQTAPKSTAKPTAKNSKRLAPSAQKAVEENTPIEDEPVLKAYRQHAAERAALGIPPLPLDAKQTAELIELIKARPPAKRPSCWTC